MRRSGCRRTGRIQVPAQTGRYRRYRSRAGSLPHVLRWNVGHGHNLAECRARDVTTDNQGGVREERVDNRSGRIGHQHHVGFVNAFPAADRGAVKHFAFFKEFGIYLMSRNRDVLFFAFGIGEAQIDKLHFVLVQHRQNVFSGHTCTLPDWSWSVVVVTRSSILLAVSP